MVGVAFDGRNFRELDEAVGLFSRHLPISPPDPGLGLDAAMAAVGSDLEEAGGWLDGFDPAAGGARPLPTPFLYEHCEVLPAVRVAGLEMRVGSVALCLEPFDLRLSVTRRPGGAELFLDHDASRVRLSDARRISGWLAVLVRAAAARPETPLTDLPMLDAAERHLLLLEEAPGSSAPAPAASLGELVAAQAEKTPEALALATAGGGTLTYRMLQARAGGLALELRRRGIGPECRVGVSIERSPEMIVALLGVLQSGAAYVPLDPDDPPERLGRIVADADVDLLVSLDGDGVAVHRGPRLALADVPEAEPGELPEAPALGGDALAYVLYTSGSTGRPKGVAVPHRAICNRLAWMVRRFPLAAGERVLHRTPFGFDASIWEIFCPLISGATVALLPAGDHRNVDAVARSIRELGVAVLQLVPSQLGPFLESPEADTGPGLRRLFCGGEVLPAHLAREAAKRLGVEVTNLYGPTETAIDATFQPVAGVRPGSGGAVPIGRPLDNLRTIVLEPLGRALPDGLPGELCIGGGGLARGYLGRPGQTAERFVPDSGSRAGERLYRTGDLVRRRPGDGVLEFFGRIDHQVKIRGVRVEPAEVEAVLSEHPGVLEAAVVARRDDEGSVRLLAYYTAPEGQVPVAENGLRAFARERLRPALVPSRLIALPSLPRTPGGKLARRDLPEPETVATTPVGAADGTATPEEELLAGIWADVLGLERVGPTDDFFALGGHSLIATQVVSRVREAFRVDLPLHRLFREPTPRSLARAIAEHRQGPLAAVEPIVPVARDGELPLSFAQRRLWFLDHHQAGSAVYNIPTSARLTGPLEPVSLARALAEIVRRHEVLRTGFLTVEGRPALAVRPRLVPALPVVDLSSLPTDRRDEEARRAARALAARPFDLASPPLFRVVLFRCSGAGPAEHVVAFVLHHIVTDAWSGGVLMRELAALYTASREGRRPALSELPVQYADFAAWQRRTLTGERLERQLAYWDHLRGLRRCSSCAPTICGQRSRPAVAGPVPWSLRSRWRAGCGSWHGVATRPCSWGSWPPSPWF